MTQAYPLHWPDGWPRTEPAARQKSSPFKVGTGKAIDELYAELERLGAENIVLSSNLTMSTFARPYAKQRQPEDPGITVYFQLNDRPMVMARDRYADWRDNIRSIGLAITALRGLQRHGGAHMMERAFEGFAALPPPGSAHPWRETLGVAGLDCTIPTVALAGAEAAYKTLAREHHPDVGGSDDVMAELNTAIAAARREFGQ